MSPGMVGLVHVLRGAAGAALDLVAPPSCLSCGAGTMGELSLCDACRRLVVPVGPRPCPTCAGPLGPGADPRSCRDCADVRPKFRFAVAGAVYPGLAGELIRRAKYGRDPLLAVPLAEIVRRALRGAGWRGAADAVVPVPPSPARDAERGFHLAEVLAHAAAEELGAVLRTEWIERTGDPPPQASLPRTERLVAARGTVALRRTRWRWRPPPSPSGLRVVLVDDVLTTGATLNECARVLRGAGAAEVRVAVAARA